MCANWNDLQRVACATSELQPVATRKRLPGVRLPLDVRQVIENVTGCRDTKTAKSKEQWRDDHT